MLSTSPTVATQAVEIARKLSRHKIQRLCDVIESSSAGTEQKFEALVELAQFSGALLRQLAGIGIEPYAVAIGGHEKVH
jgi:hypothetical protein